jgi:coenzyme F420-0:L-glutamate ligase / coenzyme F420-1:gamma-L-glutamate ligase
LSALTGMEAPTVTLTAVPGIPLIEPGDDLARILIDGLRRAGLVLRDRDVLVIAQKIVSKAEGRYVELDAVRPSSRANELAGVTAKDPRHVEVVLAESSEVVRHREGLLITEHRLGFVMANAGVDQSNIAHGDGRERVLLLPEDPDATARLLRSRIADRAGANVGVLVTDTAGRAWREGQTDIAIGAAGLLVLEDHAGRVDPYGNALVVTAPAVADELAGAAELAAGKLGRRPFVVIHGRPDLVLDAGADGAGAASLVRPESSDLFGWGSREAVLVALRGTPDDGRVFGSPVEPAWLVALLAELTGATTTRGGDDVVVETDEPRTSWVVEVAAYAHGWKVAATEQSRIRLRPVTP